MAAAEDRKISVRAVDLIKNSFGPSLTAMDLPPWDDVYVCLGHMDVIRIREIHRENEDPVFAGICKDLHRMENEGSFDWHTYPLYILHEASDGDVGPEAENAALDRFWEDEYPCIVVSRVHSDTPENGEEIEKALMTFLKDKFGKPIEGGERAGDLSIRVGKHTVHCLLCQTLELGDTVLVLKSDSLIACVEISQCLMGRKEVGDVYSYCGLHKRLFYMLPDRFKKFKSSEKAVELALKEPLPHATMRFAVHSTYFADCFWEKLGVRKDVRYITGTSDAIIDFSGENCLKLIEIIQALKMGNYDKDVQRYTAQDAFDDVVTRVGILYDTEHPWAKPPAEVISEKNRFKKSQRDLINNLNVVVNWLSDRNYDWMLALSSQVRILLSLMNNCVTDDLSLLIWPSANAFIKRLRFMRDSDKKPTSDQINGIKSFLDGWMTLTNDIVHLEVQLMQDPKLQAPRVHVPAALLAYYMAFLDKLNTLLNEIDKLSGCWPSLEGSPVATRYVPLIAHNIGSRPNTLCVNDPIDNFNDSYIGDCALLVSLPASLMYYPEDVAVIFCHEYLHYSGEIGRQREKRLNSILKTCAGLLLNRWLLDRREPGFALLKNFEDAATYLEGLIREKVNFLCGSTGSSLYFHSLDLYMPDILRELYLDWELQSELISKYSDTEKLQEEFIKYAQRFTPQEQADSVAALGMHWENAILLYRECYADAAAILCLGLDIGVYLRSTFQQECEVKQKYRKPEEPEDKFELLKIQKAVVCSVVWPGAKVSDLESCPEQWIGIDCYIAQIESQKDLLVNIGEEKKILALQAEYLPLMSYLSNCVDVFRCYLNEEKLKPYKDQLQKMYNEISQRDINLVEFRREIDAYHKMLRQEIENW